MSDLNFGHLLPFYLDETDEQVVALNDALLKLEQDQSDSAALAVAFRIVHTIKGSSAALGFTEVNKLTHHLESFFDMLRSGQRQLDHDTLNLFFKCLDELRNYHQRLRETGEAHVDFSDLINEVILQIRKVQESESPPSSQPDKSQNRPAAQVVEEAVTQIDPGAAPAEVPPTTLISEVGLNEDEASYRIQIAFENGLSLPEMKARLIAKRLTNLGEILASDPPIEKIDDIAELTGIAFDYHSLAPVDDIRKSADMAGVKSIVIEDLRLSRQDTATKDDFTLHTDLENKPQSKPVDSDRSIEPVADDQALKRSESGAESQISISPVTDPSQKNPATGDAAEPRPKAPEKSQSKSFGKVGETVRVELDRLDHLMNLTGELVLSKSRFVQVSSALNDRLGLANRRLQPKESLARLEHLKSSLSALSSGQASLDAVTHRMNEELRRLTEEIEAMSAELARAHQARASLEDLGEAVHQLTRVCDGLQKGVLDTRMIPIGPLFERFRRVIRDLSHATGKEIRLKISGESTELDKRVIDELADPLVHMVRNAGDHGLETPEDREKSGKSRAGTISLAAAHSGDRVTITVTDDGRGINADRIRKKIVEKGLVDQITASRLTDRELVQYIWHPGLSTAESVTDISGRGVGMDIVKSRIESLNGTIDIRTNPGQGTTFVIRLPLTLAILPSLLVRFHEEVYAIALDHIREIVEVRPNHMFQIRKRRVIEIREKVVPILSLDDLFQWGNKPYVHKETEQPDNYENGTTTRIVILHSGDEMVGLIVDQLLGLQEVVLKSLEKNLGPVDGLSGASILGDGRVSLILDVDRLIERAATGISVRNGVA